VLPLLHFDARNITCNGLLPLLHSGVSKRSEFLIHSSHHIHERRTTGT